MTDDNAGLWGPRSNDDESIPAAPAAPAARSTSQWAPPLAPSAADPGRHGGDGSSDGDELVFVPESIEIAPVVAEVRKASKVATRIVAAVIAAAMVGGGALLAFDAGSADGGAASPEEAFEVLLSAAEAGDVLAIAEILEPTERETLLDAGVDIASELSRLGVLSTDLDLSAVSGVQLELGGFEPRVERPRSGLAHIYAGKGVVTVAVDGAELPFGSLLTDDLFPLDYSYSSTDLVEPQQDPIVAVQRNGRWYLSVWYSVAELARLTLDKPLPDLGRRPASIGGPTPEAAVRSFLDDALRLDVRRMIGGLDPNEMAALYDYAPLFLDSATASANNTLQSLEDDGWVWGLDQLELASETDGDVARVQLVSASFSASGDRGTISVSVGAEAVVVDARTIDPFFGDETTSHFEFGGDCFSASFDDGSGPHTEQYCGSINESVPFIAGGIGSLGSLGLADSLTVVTHLVDGQWYISPVRTGRDAIVRSLEMIEPDQLSEFIDSLDYVAGAVRGSDGGFATVGASDYGSTDSGAFGPAIPIVADNLALLAPGLDPLFAYDLDAQNYTYEVDYFAPALGSDLDVVAGLYASVDSPSGEVAVVVLGLADSIDATSLFDPLIAGHPEAVGSHDGQRLSITSAAGQSVVVHVDGSRLLIVGGYGASALDVAAAADIQLG